MKKILVTFLALLVWTGCASAQVLTSAEVKTQVAKIFEDKFRAMYDGDIEVKITATQFANLQLPDGKVTYKIVNGGEKILARDIKRVDVFVNNVYVKSLNLPAQTSIYKEVLVASELINREQTLTKECTEIKRIDVALRGVDFVLSEDMLVKDITTKKMFQKGEIIDKRFVKMRPDVARNSEVRVFFVSNGSVMITIDGTATMDGMIGDYVNVENRNYKKTYNGKVIGENKVLVAI